MQNPFEPQTPGHGVSSSMGSEVSSFGGCLVRKSKAMYALTIYDEGLDSGRRVLEVSEDAFQSRALTAMFEFIRGMPMEVMKRRKELIVAAYGDNDEIARIDERYREALEQRDRKIEERDRRIEQLEEEIMRLRGL
eukprot:scaffold20524_cov85-Skeletonema_dohrnii-CCMP3373.AAC.7